MTDTLSLLARAHQGDKEARATLTEQNMGLVWSVARRFLNRNVEMDDLFQIGSIGLLKAIDHFDTTYGVCFSTYAVPMISGEIRRHLRDNSMLKVSRSLKERAVQMYREKEKLEIKLGREPTMEEIAAAMSIAPEELAPVLEATMDVESLEQAVYRDESGGRTLMDRLEDPKDRHEKVLDQLLLEELLKDLTQQERHLLYMRYEQELTQSYIAEKLGISQVQVSRMEKRILHKIRLQQKMKEHA